MKYKSRLSFLIIIIVAGLFFYSCSSQIDEEAWDKAVRITQEALVIDSHVDTPMLMMRGAVDIGKESERGQVDLVKMKKGGLDAVFFAVFVANEFDDKNPSRRAFEMIDEVLNQVEKYPNLVEMAYSAKDIERIKRNNKKAILLGMENGGPIEDSTRLLRVFYRLGIRYITLTHNSHNKICDSSTDEENDPVHDGLSEFGEEVVEEMNRLGIIIDVSHISDDAFYDVLEKSKAPIMASHSCCRDLCDHPRNLTDEMMEELASKGGVIQIGFVSAFLDEEFLKKSDVIWEKLDPEFAKLREKHGGRTSGYYSEAFDLWRGSMPDSPPFEVLIDHIKHAVEVAGIDHVGLGSDFDGAGSYPEGLDDASKLPLITYHLLEEGFSEEDIKKILGGNFMRLFREVENTSVKISLEKKD